MADEITNDIILDGSISAAAEAIDGILKAHPSKQDVNGNPVEADDGPDPEPDQPQAAQTETDPADAPVEGTKAQTGDTTATPVQPATAKAPASSPELETRLAEAAREKQAAEAARDQYIKALNVHIPQLQAAIKGKYPDIQSEDDLIALADPNSPKYDPMRYNSFQADAARLQKAARDRESAMQEQQKTESERLQAWRTEQQTKIGELIPELKDTAKGPALAQKLWAYAQEAGYGREQMERASATDVHLLYQAMLYRDIKATDAAKVEQAAKDLEAAKAKAAKAPPVQTPGTRQTSAKDEKIQADYERFKKSGHINDAADVFRHILN